MKTIVVDVACAPDKAVWTVRRAVGGIVYRHGIGEVRLALLEANGPAGHPVVEVTFDDDARADRFLEDWHGGPLDTDPGGNALGSREEVSEP